MMTTKASKPPKVFWTDAEKDLVAIAAIEHFNSSAKPRWLESLYAGADTLPIKRHRPHSSLGTSSSWFRKRGAELLTKRDADERLKKADVNYDKSMAEVVAAENGMLTPEKTAEVLGLPSDMSPKVDEVIENALESIVSAMFGGALKNAFCKVIRSAALDAIAEMGEEFPEVMHILQKPKAEVKERKPKVVIAGLIGVQITRIKEEFGQVFDLVFYEVDDSLGHFKDKLKFADHVLVNTSKINHQVYNYARKDHTVIHINGDLSAMRRRMQMLQQTGK